jgi:hypothetical protein
MSNTLTTKKINTVLADDDAGAFVERTRFAFATKTLKCQIQSLRREKETAYVKREEGK